MRCGKIAARTRSFGYNEVKPILNASHMHHTTVITLDTIKEIKQLLLKAGQIALEGRTHAHAQLKADHTPFTDVELAMEALIIPFLQQRFPGAQIISEENGVDGAPSDLVWALDPVDGTKVYLNGLATWGVSLGLLEKGEPRLGFFYQPASRDFYWGGSGFGAFLNDIDITTQVRLDFDDPLAFMAVTSSAHRRYDIDYPRVHAFGSTAAHLCYVARGIAVGAFLRRVSLWDLAGVLPILDQTGVSIEFMTQGPFSARHHLDSAKLPDSLIAAHPEIMPRVRQAIRRK